MIRFSQVLLVVLLLCSVVSGPVNGQKNPYIFRHITTEDGLADNDVHYIVQDTKGFIWIATKNGLQKYDGYNFTTFHHNPQDSQSISSDNIIALSTDDRNRIWALGFLAGFNRFDPVTNRCDRLGESTNSNFKDLFLGNSICRDRQGNMWLVAAKGIATYDIQAGKLNPIKNIFPKDFHPYIMTAKLDTSTNQLWLADAAHGVCMYDIGRDIFFWRRNNPDSLPVFNLDCRPFLLYLDREKNLWIHGFDGFLATYNIAQRRTKSYYLYEAEEGIVRYSSPQVPRHQPLIYITTMSGDAQGNIWIAAGSKGLVQYIPKLDSFRSIPPATSTTNGLNFNAEIHCIVEDKEGNIWIGTDKGLNIFNPLRQQFHFFENDPFNPTTKTKNETMAFTQTSSGDVWVATFGSGLTSFGAQLDPKKQYTYRPSQKGTIPDPSNLVWALESRGQDSVLLGYQGGWLSIANAASGAFRHFRPKELDSLTIMNMSHDKIGTVWLALASGIASWIPGSQHAIRYRDFYPNNGVNHATASVIMAADSGHIWVGTMGLGLQLFDTMAKSFTRIYVPSKYDPHSISGAIVNCIIPLGDTAMAIGTATGGIDLFNLATRQFSSISAADGLPSNYVSALFFSPPHTLWAATGGSLCKIDLPTRHINRFGPQDGIKDLDFSGCQHMVQLKDGRLLVGYTGGFLYFYPDSIRAVGPPADVSITGMRIFEQPLSIDSLLHRSDTIRLSYKQNFITIQFAALNFLEANRTSYYYQLKGVDKDWVGAQDQRLATYTNLQGGAYFFEVKAANSDGLFSKHITRLAIVIEPPFWQTWWFQGLVLLSMVMVLYLLYRYRVNQLLRLQNVRNEISKDLHDDVGATLSSISILSQVAKDRMEDGQREQSSSILTKINSYSQEMVEKMGDIVWAVNARNDSLADVIQRLKNSFMESAATRGIALRIEVNPLLESKTMPMQVRKNIYLIAKEALNNAIKYCAGTEVRVVFGLAGGIMDMTVTDNGQGFDSGLAAKGNGLINMKARALEMKAKLGIHTHPGGTTVSLRMPIPKNR